MYRFTRYINKHQPGDVVPDTYSAEQIARWLDTGKIEEVETDQKPKRTTKK